MLWTNIIGFKAAKIYVKISKIANLGYVFGHILSVALATRHINLGSVLSFIPRPTRFGEYSDQPGVSRSVFTN